MGGGALRRVDGEGASRFGPGRGRPWGRVARVFLGSKEKVSEWRNFGVEWLLGAANGDENEKNSMSESEDPRVTPTRGAPKFVFQTYVRPPATVRVIGGGITFVTFFFIVLIVTCATLTAMRHTVQNNKKRLVCPRLFATGR